MLWSLGRSVGPGQSTWTLDYCTGPWTVSRSVNQLGLVPERSVVELLQLDCARRLERPVRWTTRLLTTVSHSVNPQQTLDTCTDLGQLIRLTRTWTVVELQTTYSSQWWSNLTDAELLALSLGQSSWSVNLDLL
jgi:hypothetical protein